MKKWKALRSDDRYVLRIEPHVEMAVGIVSDLYMFDNLTKEEYEFAIMNGDNQNRDDLYLYPRNPYGVYDETWHLADILTAGNYEKLQHYIFDTKDDYLMMLTENDVLIFLDEFVRDEYIRERIGNDFIDKLSAYEDSLRLGYPPIPEWDKDLRNRNKIVIEQISTLEALHFWHSILVDQDENNIREHKVIQFTKKLCDEWAISSKNQEYVLSLAESNVPFIEKKDEIMTDLKRNYKSSMFSKEFSPSKSIQNELKR